MCAYCNQVKTITSSEGYVADGVIFGTAWEGPISYYFTSAAADYNYTYESQKNYAPATENQRNAALFALEQSSGNAADDGFSVEGFTAVQIGAGNAASSNLRFGQSDAPSTAYAYMPGQYDQAGDMWFGRNYDYTKAQAGNYAWQTVMHETGHALGLKHGQEAQPGFAALPAEYDSIEYTTMTYRSYVGGPAGAYSYSTWSAPQTYMMLDIAALQKLYGADFETNSGDTVYRWTPSSGDTLVDGAVGIDAGGKTIFATIWDGGGRDTYDLSAYRSNLKIDLAPGGASTFSRDQLANLGRGNEASGSIYNAMLYEGDQRSLIEDALGGAGNDRISGNEAGNRLVGSAGNDRLFGLGGDDILIGGRGNDKLFGGLGDDVMTGGAGRDLFRIVLGEGHDVITDFARGEDRIALSGFGAFGFGELVAKAVQDGADVVIAFDDTNSLTLNDTVLAQLSADDFRFVI